jgi:hypothetical protein
LSLMPREELQQCERRPVGREGNPLNARQTDRRRGATECDVRSSH